MNTSTRIFTAMAILLMTAISCERPDDDPEDKPDGNPPVEKPEEKPDTPVVATKDNTFVIDGKEASFGSISVSNFGEYLCIAASPEEGVESFDAMFGQDEYLYVAISPLLNGKEFDLMTENDLFTVISTVAGAGIETLSPEVRTEITEGRCSFGYAEGKTEVFIALELSSGVSFSAKMSAEEAALVVNENTFSLDGNTKPIRTVFHRSQDGRTELYLTPAGISYFEDLNITTYYAYLILEDSQCNGKTLSVKDIEAAGYGDNFNEIYVSSTDTQTTGTVNVLRDAEDPAHYTVAASLDFDGTALEMSFDGKALDTAPAQEAESEVVYDGKSEKINKVTLDKRDTPQFTHSVNILTENGTDICITLPHAYIDGTPHGFSQSPYLTIAYGDVIFSKATGYSGTVNIGTEGETMTIEATNYKNFNIYYKGPFSVIE